MIGWTVRRADESFVVESSVRIPPLGQRVFANSDNPGRNGGFVGHYEFDASAFSLPNTTNQIYQLSFDGQEITAIPVSATVVTEGVSIGLDPRLTTPLEALDWSRWCLATEAMSGGDYGSPGTENRMCPGLEDVDGDGYTLAGGDCDDNDAAVNPGATEVWGDWTDNDCSGQADEANMSALSSTTLDGGTTNSNPHQWGYLGQLAVGDVDDDGKEEWLVGGVNAYDYVGGVVWLPSESYAVLGCGLCDKGRPCGYDEKQASVPLVPKWLTIGDGIADLVVAGHDYFEPDNGCCCAL